MRTQQQAQKSEQSKQSQQSQQSQRQQQMGMSGKFMTSTTRVEKRNDKRVNPDITGKRQRTVSEIDLGDMEPLHRHQKRSRKSVVIREKRDDGGHFGAFGHFEMNERDKILRSQLSLSEKVAKAVGLSTALPKMPVFTALPKMPVSTALPEMPVITKQSKPIMTKASQLPDTVIKYTISEDDSKSGSERKRRQFVALSILGTCDAQGLVKSSQRSVAFHKECVVGAGATPQR
jgi:hypothetical protein